MKYSSVKPLVAFLIVVAVNIQAVWEGERPSCLPPYFTEESGTKYVELDLEPVMCAVMSLLSSKDEMIFLNYVFDYCLCLQGLRVYLT